jgi:hypothetical protein
VIYLQFNYYARLLKNSRYRKLSLRGVVASIAILIGLFGPWLIYGFDSYATINPKTNTGQLSYHSIIELNPLFGTIYKDNILLERYWFMSPGLDLAALFLIVSSVLFVFKHRNSWINFLLFLLAIVGFVFFFMSVGDEVSIGVFYKVGWGIYVTGLGLFAMFVVAFLEMSRNSVSRFMD